MAAKNSVADRALLALGLSAGEIEIYNYFLLYGPVNLDSARKGVNFPKKFSAKKLQTLAAKLKDQGYLALDKDSYKTSGLEFLIQKASLYPKLKKITQQLKNWEIASDE